MSAHTQRQSGLHPDRQAASSAHQQRDVHADKHLRNSTDAQASSSAVPMSHAFDLNPDAQADTSAQISVPGSSDTDAHQAAEAAESQASHGQSESIALPQMQHTDLQNVEQVLLLLTVSYSKLQWGEVTVSIRLCAKAYISHVACSACMRCSDDGLLWSPASL